jgi:hypothetical protein
MDEMRNEAGVMGRQSALVLLGAEGAGTCGARLMVAQ